MLIYGQGSSDIHFSINSRFICLLELYDQVVADCGFKIKTGLALKQCSLSIQPSSAKGNQVVKTMFMKQLIYQMFKYMWNEQFEESRSSKFQNIFAFFLFVSP